MRRIIKILKEELLKNRDIIMINIISSAGSVPRGAGAKMLVGESGRVFGTIGGGALEYAAEQRAIELLKEKKSDIKEFYLRENSVEDLGMVCGGDVEVCMLYLSSENTGLIADLDRIDGLYENDEEIWLLIHLGEKKIPSLGFYSASLGYTGEKLDFDPRKYHKKNHFLVEIDKQKRYFEKISERGRVYIFGGGHIAQALVPVLAPLGFKSVVVENREEFCRPELFSNLAKTVLTDYREINRSIQIKKEDYICIMSRGHKDDMIIQAQVLKSPAQYIGVIGSARKKDSVFQRLREMGFGDKELSRIHTPIGLDISAESPEEIAISIAAELIQVRADSDSR